MRKLTLLLFLFMATKSFAILKLNQTPTLPYNLSVVMEKVANATLVHGFFESHDLTTTIKTVWEGPGIYVYPPSATQMTISSSDANDTSAGTGMRQITVEGLDADYNPISETIILNGQTPVTTVNSYFRVQGIGMRGIDVGATGSNEGDIYMGVGTVTLGIPATIYNLISATENSSHSGFFTIPAGFKGYFYGVEVSSPAGKPLEIGGFIKNGNPVFFQISGFHIEGYVDSEPPFPDHIDEKTDIEFRAKMDSGGGAVKAHAHLLMIK